MTTTSRRLFFGPFLGRTLGGWTLGFSLAAGSAWFSPARAGDVDDLVSSLSARPELREAVEAPLRATESAGLPSAWLVAKAREGVAKRVPPALLGRALERMAGRLREAPRVLPEGIAPTPELIETTALALDHDLSPDEVRRTLHLARGEVDLLRKAGPVRVLRLAVDLRELGMSAGEARTVIEAVARRSPADLERSGSLVVDLRRLHEATRSPWTGLVSEFVGSLEKGAGGIGEAVREVARRHAATLPPAAILHGRGLAPEGPPSGQDGTHGKADEKRPPSAGGAGVSKEPLGKGPPDAKGPPDGKGKP